MKRIFKVVLIIILACLAMGAVSKQRDKYYRKLNPYIGYTIKGMYPVTSEMSKKINCYHFIYNSAGKLIKVEYLKNGKLRKDPLFEVAQIVIEYSKGNEKRTYLDKRGKPIAKKNGVYSINLKFVE